MQSNGSSSFNSQANAAATASKRKKQMSFNKFKATVRKLADLPWEDLKNLFSWPSGGSILQAENPNLLIAKASDSRGETIAFVSVEPILLINNYTFNPASDPSDTPQAGDDIDAALAQTANVSRLWIVVPDEAPPMKDEKFIRVLERKVYQQPVTTTHGVAYSNYQSSVGFLN
jgi:hypothetical protein